jgi:hypothetical protein
MFENCNLSTIEDLSRAQAGRIQIVQGDVEKYSAASGVSPLLVNGVIWVESRFNPAAVSSAGARGLMQLMPATGEAMFHELGHPMDSNPFDPSLNIQAGVHLLSRLAKRFDNHEPSVLAAYNAGSGNVKKSGPGPWMSYVRAVLSAVDMFRGFESVCDGNPETTPVIPKNPPIIPKRPPVIPKVPKISQQNTGGGGVGILLIAALGIFMFSRKR